ncbi:hypothetical protein [Xenorhabdus bovienii]|uniref:Secreted protein n=1 Tax=Xenorhabdus bovienii TaxID=40576 RepID=A0AAJ1N073_XENBV|nr:hypothetical protein [Xenorhabdus bovienii]MDE1479515.1 hypothetical protein [Xenorhabdus bovienii]MDE9511177.1 hypothetical protein [Xenorhabdus bovienii]MDE9522834.1 hypothetical protein [Xenorhabdus bovienii]
MINKRKNILAGVVLSLVAGVSSAAPILECGSVLPSGTHEGKLVSIINKADWGQPHYWFESSAGKKGCVRFDTSKINEKTVYNAFILKKDIKIQVDSAYNILSIGY